MVMWTNNEDIHCFVNLSGVRQS